MSAPLTHPAGPRPEPARTSPPRRRRRFATAAAAALLAATTAAWPAHAAPGTDDTDPAAAPRPQLTASTQTSITDLGNRATDAVVGENVTYTLDLTVPAQSGVFDGILATSVPTGVSYVSASASFAPDALAPALGALPPGVSLNPANGTLRLGPSYANNTASPQLFEVVVTARVSTTPVTNQGVQRQGMATLRSNAAPGGVPLTPITAPTVVTVVTPSPWMRVSDDDADGQVSAGQTVGFRLRADNVLGRPDAHDGWYVACVPAGLTFTGFVGDAPGATTTPGTGANGCGAAETRIAWDLGDVTDAGEVLSYQATVDQSAVTGTAVTTTAVLTASTLRDGKASPAAADNPLERAFVRTEEHTLTVVGRAADLAVSQQLTGPAVAGSAATYSLTVQNNGPSDSSGPVVLTDELPAGVDLLDAAGPTWSCDPSAGTVTCTRAAGLAVGEVAPAVTVVVGIASDRTAALTNTVRVQGPDTDPVPDNDASSTTTDVAGSADLSVEKDLIGRLVAGEQATYRVTVHNAGPSLARDVHLADTLPAELTLVDTVPVSGTWSCTAAGQDVDCDLGEPLSDGADARVLVVVDVAANHRGNVHNEAAVTSSTDDPNPANDSDADDSVNQVRANLSVALAHTGPVVAGSSVEYVIDVANAGPSASAGPVTVTDVLPAGLSLASAQGDGWRCDADGRLLTCTHDQPLARSAAADPIHVVADVSPDAGPATVENLASVAGPETDPDLADNTATDPTEIVDNANLSVTKTPDDGGQAVAGTDTAFTITVHNDGPSDADAVTVTDTLPPGMTLVSIAGDGWTCDPGTPATCARASLAAGADATIAVEAHIAASVPAGETLVNEAEAGTATAGDDTADNTGQAAVEVTTSSDLSLAMSGPDVPVAAGTTATFGLAVSNDGPSDALGTTVVDQLPPGLAFASSTGPWDCTAAPEDADGQTVTCVLQPALTDGADAAPLSITADLASSVDPGQIVNTATVSSDAAEPDPADNTDTWGVDVFTSADLSITVSHDPPARVGSQLDLRLAVANDGPSDARGVVVSDDLPTGLELIAATGDGWTCTALASQLTCEHDGPLPPGPAEAITVTTRVLASAYPGVANTAAVDAATDDPDAADNTQTDQITVPPLADLSIVKRHPQPLRVDRNVGYRLTVTNNGPTVDPGPVTVVDQLPAGLAFVAADNLAFDCGVDGQTVTCVDADGLAVGERVVIVLIARVNAAAGTEIVNTATVGSPTEDGNPADNSSTDPAVVQP